MAMVTWEVAVTGHKSPNASGGAYAGHFHAPGTDCSGLCAQHLLSKGERLSEHPIMIRDCADGSQIIMDALLIQGYSRKTKTTTARAVLRVGRRSALKHAGDFRIDATEALRYTRLAEVWLAPVQVGEYPAGQHASRKAGYFTLYRHVWKIFRTANERSEFWLAALGKRRMRVNQMDMPKTMRYHDVGDSWRVPKNKRDEYRNYIRAKNEFARANAWAFETVAPVETLRGPK